MIDWPVAELLPHAGDMVLLDAVEVFDAESIETRLEVKPSGLLNLPDGSLPAWVGMEMMAQTVAAFAGCHARQAGLPVELGFLLGTRSFQCNVEHFRPAACCASARFAHCRMTTAWAYSNAISTGPASMPRRASMCSARPKWRAICKSLTHEPQHIGHRLQPWHRSRYRAAPGAKRVRHRPPLPYPS